MQDFNFGKWEEVEDDEDNIIKTYNTENCGCRVRVFGLKYVADDGDEEIYEETGLISEYFMDGYYWTIYGISKIEDLKNYFR